jgi:6-pyruvoyltetrahydropterin/6-carboxytetrahydropterin synthase
LPFHSCADLFQVGVFVELGVRMARCAVTRRVHNAAHRLHKPRFSEEWNRETFGECCNPNYHGHNYELELTVEGEIHPDTGYVMDLNKLRDLAQEHLLRHLDHRNLNLDVPWFKSIIPSSENIALACWRELQGGASCRAGAPNPFVGNI